MSVQINETHKTLLFVCRERTVSSLGNQSSEISKVEQVLCQLRAASGL